jgi:hypothetical protein
MEYRASLMKVNMQSGEDRGAKVPPLRARSCIILGKRWRSLSTKHPDSDSAADDQLPWTMTGMSRLLRASQPCPSRVANFRWPSVATLVTPPDPSK